VQVKTRGIYADGKLQVGEVVYTDPSYLRQAKNTPGQFPRVKLDGFYENIANAFGAFGGQGGQGGVAIGPGAVGGRGGNGGSAHIHVGAGGSPRPVQPPSNHQAPAGADLRADLASADKPTESPAYVDVTDKVRGSWAAVEVGDVVTATHRTERAGVAISNSRTSEVVYNRGYTFGADAGKHWCELQLSSHTRYDAYKITKVLRLQKQRLLSERRKPVEVTVTRLVPANHVWKPSYLTAKGNAYVEADQGGTYWLTFTDGDLAGKKLRLKEGRDTVTYTAIMGDVRVSGDFEQLVTITHSK
jgi:hypothetical protein